MNVFELPVHPDADRFPKYSEDKLNDLAESIKSVGQLNPIKVADYNGTLHIIDGRHRLAACKIAGVEPDCRTLNGENLQEVIVAENTKTHDLTKGQKAMFHAVILPQPMSMSEAASRKGKAVTTGNSRAEQKTLSQARKIISVFGIDSPEVEGVLNGEPFSTAYESAMLEQQEREQREIERKRIAEERQKKTETLQEESPDLWMKVEENVLSEDQAWTLYETEETRNRSDDINLAQTLGLVYRDMFRGLLHITDKTDLQTLVEFEKDQIISGTVKRYFPEGITNYINQNKPVLKTALKIIQDHLE